MSNVETWPLILSNIVTDLTHSIKLFLILSHNIIKKHFLRVAINSHLKLTATIQIFYLELELSRSARSPAFRSGPPWQINSPLKKNIFFLQPTLLFKKLYRGNKEARRAIQGANLSNYAINGLGLLPQASLRIIFCSCQSMNGSEKKWLFPQAVIL